MTAASAKRRYERAAARVDRLIDASIEAGLTYQEAGIDFAKRRRRRAFDAWRELEGKPWRRLRRRRYERAAAGVDWVIDARELERKPWRRLRRLRSTE